MQIRELLNDDEAVSPVIGVILMVAITVILAAVIATFVLGLGDQISNTAPQASFSFEYEQDASPGSGDLTVTHNGGATIEAGELFVRGATDSGAWSSSTVSSSTYAPTSDINAGDSVTVGVDASDTVRITYEPSGGGDSATLGKWTGPDA